MGLTEPQKKAIARARKALGAELGAELSGDLPPGMDAAAASAYWRGWLRQALTTLIDELSDNEGDPK